MRLYKTEREEFRKRIKILIPQMEKSEIVNQYQKEGLQLIRRIESKMKKIDTNCIESLKGVKAKVRSIGDNEAYALFK